MCYADRIVIPVTSRDVHGIQADCCTKSSQERVSIIRAKPGRATGKAATHMSDLPAQGRAGKVMFKVILKSSPLDTSTPIWSANSLFEQFKTCLEAEQAAEPPWKLTVVTLLAERYRPTSEKNSKMAKHTPDSVTAECVCIVGRLASKSLSQTCPAYPGHHKMSAAPSASQLLRRH